MSYCMQRGQVVRASVGAQVIASRVHKIRELQQLSEKEERCPQVFYLTRLNRPCDYAYEATGSEDSEERSASHDW